MSNYNNQVGAKVIGITGSNGKTSTKDIIASILETRYNTHKTSGNYNNEYGLPLTLLSMDEDT
ncbi:MAG: UDP-N-acetylmuramoyl-tripeptide--D-alanyl-D-alanine ligase, partial [Tissierellales bacterium]|nr:UDP-N-acetylmuramoyl-tripeptide--D-alanyl-D-alanine ligase [Tissierellales bacterium]